MDWFTEYTTESAPPASRRFLAATQKHMGYLPVAMARWASSPQLLEGFGKMTALFDAATLDPLARETVIMTVATRNGCEICVAMHTARLTALDAPAEVIAALREGGPVPDPRLEAVRVFTVRAMNTAGAVGDEAMAAFSDAGFTSANALEVVLGIGTYTMSTLANRMTGAPVDEQLAAFA
jgi:AhpD family alkylhydroperoxidase